MTRSNTAGLLVGMGALLALAASPAAAVDVPPAPNVQAPEATGDRTVAYWTVAYDGEHRRTSASAPTVVQNLPAALSADDPVRIEIEPVEDAVRYDVLKTEVMSPVSNVTVEPANEGDQTYYYWVRWRNSWRFSELAGPVAVTCGDPEGNVISWDRPANATYYDVFRTDSPEPPVGRANHAVAWMYWPDGGSPFWWFGQATPGEREVEPGERVSVTEVDRLSAAVAGEPATPVDQPPVGHGLLLVGRTSGAEAVLDTGLPLVRGGVPHINVTDRAPLTGPAADQVDILGFRGAGYLLQMKQNPPNLGSYSYGGAHLEPFVIHNVIEQGGHSEREPRPIGYNGPKSWINGLTTHVESHTSSQHGSLSSTLQVYGTGDAIPFVNTVDVYGGNNDGGDEGAMLQRNSVRRLLKAWNAELTADARRGDQTLKVENIDYRTGGSERIIVNLSQRHDAGRIISVDNVEIHGRDTQWTTDMQGRFISFDVDTVHPGQGTHRTNDTHRTWYWIEEVHGPEHLTMRAMAGWGFKVNLGYSNFIWDPETRDGPSAPGSNTLAIKHLPEDRKQAAREGGYQILPGVRLADPWKRDQQTLHVEPLIEDWHAGDQIRLTAGPQAWVNYGRFMLRGDALAQDMIHGLSLGNDMNRMTNGPAIQIGGPGKHGFASGVHVTLNKDGHGNGLVIDAATRWDDQGLPAGNSGVDAGAIVVPDNLPAVVGKHHWRYPHLRWRFDPEDDQQDAMVIGQPRSGNPIATFTRFSNASTFHGRVVLKDELVGNDKTRGTATFNADGETRQFQITFEQQLTHKPVVTFSTNRFERSRLVETSAHGFTIEFEAAPPDADEPIMINWLAQQ